MSDVHIEVDESMIVDYLDNNMYIVPHSNNGNHDEEFEYMVIQYVFLIVQIHYAFVLHFSNHE